MKLIFEKSHEGRTCANLPVLDVPRIPLPESMTRGVTPRLPELSENEISRHYTELAGETRGVNNGFYPLGSCTMKYNPKINDEIASLPGFAEIHPLQPVHTVQGALEAFVTGEKLFCEITGMDAMSFQPAAGAQGELLGLLLIKAYHCSRGDFGRTKIIVPDSSHGTNPASATMADLEVISIPSNDEGCVDLDMLKASVGPDTAGIMLTNPNTLGIFEKDILEMTEIIHDAGGLCYYDGANMNAIMGIARPGDMGFDVIHLNLHKTFSTPHGGGGPGSGPVGCKEILKPFLPKNHPVLVGGKYAMSDPAESIGIVKAFYGHFLIFLRALTYVLMLGAEGIKEAAQTAVLNANYMLKGLSDIYDVAYPGLCMHEFVLSLENLKKASGISATDIAKMLLDNGIHPPTMYFPLIVKEALMIEPTETEPKEILDGAIEVFRAIHKAASENPGLAHASPLSTTVGRLDEVGAARNPKVRYEIG